MNRWTDEQVLDALALAVPVDRGNGRRPATTYEAVSTDTRSLGEGALFVAIRGDRFDGHAFLEDAFESGARAAVVEDVPEGAPPMRYYRVPDTLTALGRLGRYRRRSVGGRVVAITGTNGKTTTKEMARVVLATRYATHATPGNLNNLIGVPLTLLAAPEGTEALVVEIGMNMPGEIARLAEIVEPDIGVVTAVAEGHLEGVGTVEGVLREKTSLLSRVTSGGLALVAEEPRALPDRARSLTRRVQVAGWTDRADDVLRAHEPTLDRDGRVRFTWQGRDVTLPFGGRVHVRNALLALGIGLEWGVDPDAAVDALAAMEPPAMRGETHRYGGLTVIADCYNANPSSMAPALDTLVRMPRGGGRVAVVGSMLELGARSETLHRETAERIAAADVDLIVAVGLFVPAFDALRAEGRFDLEERLIAAPDADSVVQPLIGRLSGDEVVLLKGSRGVALEALLPPLRGRFGDTGGEEG
jgi:UDP-N-acetylmuramoyl-tripeptide--D-alanyl-D-alanine ligase